LISFKHWSNTSSVDDFSVKTHKPNSYLLVLFNPCVFCSFLKFLKNVESHLTILWSCLHERCFYLHTSFNRLKTGSTRKIYLSFRFGAAPRKKSFHISIKSHSAEVKLCKPYQFAEAINGIASWKIFCPYFMFHHFTINCIGSMLLAALYVRAQTSFGISQTVYFSFISRNVYIKQILHTWFIIIPFSCLQSEEFSQRI